MCKSTMICDIKKTAEEDIKMQKSAMVVSYSLLTRIAKNMLGHPLSSFRKNERVS